MTTLQQLDALIELLGAEGSWIKRAYATDDQGQSQCPISEKACMWCLIGGVSKISGVDPLCNVEGTDLYKSIESHLAGEDMGLLNWNDYINRTQSQVIDMLKEVRGNVFKSEVDQVWSES